MTEAFSSSSHVRVERGIRYARAARFGRPALEPLSQDRLVALAPQPNTDGDEDCLHLTVWSPRSAQGAPVLVWIHGGAHVSGGAADPVTDGARLAETQGLVVVAVQYRLGAFGYLLMEDDGAGDGANAALHDQLTALRWVSAHIADFGGDPDSVTVMGQSSGGVDVLTLLAIAADSSLFHRVIAHSCTAERAHSLSQNEEIREQLACAAGVSSTAGLRALSTKALLRAQTRLIEQRSASAAIDSLPFRPVIDGRLLHRRPLEEFATGTGSAIPLLTGTNRYEALPWLGDSPDDARALDLLLGAVAPKAHPDELAAAYENDRRSVPTARDLREAVLSEVMYRSPVARVVAARVDAPTFAYVFDPDGLDGVDPGHSGELPLVFGTVDGPAPATALSRRMMDAWGSFARDGCPSSEPEWRDSRHGVFHWGPDPRMDAANDPAMRAVLDAADAECDRL